MSDNGFLPKSRPNTAGSRTNSLIFMVTQLLSQVNVATLVRVVDVHTESRTAATGTVDVVPLLTEVTADGEVIENVTVYGLPFLRLQGGATAVIVDPQVGDVGICVFGDKDLSNVVDAKGASNPPGSVRRFTMSDGLYLGGWNASVEPETYIVIDDSGIDIVAPNGASVTAPTLTVNGNLHVTGNVTGDGTAGFTGDVTGQGTSLHTHVHSGVQTGGSNTGAPV